ncbi:hypothetical protein HBI70_175070 [Parastagonospora nodorum]|nr:hypothetical protein HBI10_095260 [Parastagonospora nodorum]KAH4033436.1 hypothetical protein HBI13_010500 [Parastagonospora nodorum]KAH5028929.1 hypothetical protein HBI75_131550 [Parastagonospora nodorum]KAH5258581.1 hypothetical protein HBI70_175070 [Parastagonospora nodorum]KAH5614682.1 hypothetical protein HBI45_038560 [Parastagonospora nodorum]
MWVAGSRPAPRPQRTTSINSIGSVPSPLSSRSPSTTGLNRSSTNYVNNDMGSFNLRKPQYDQPAPVFRRKTKWELAAEGELPEEDDISSRSSTLDGEEEYMDLKPVPSMLPRKDLRNEEPRAPNPAPHIPGPLESQLAALMSKLIYMEQSNPAVSVSPEEFKDLQKRLKALEEEKKTWTKRHEAIWALRDEDVENNIKIRGMLAKARRELEGMTKLRDEDLNNVLIVRAKLAEKTRELERLQAQGGRTSPSRGRPASYLERRGTSDLFVAAKTAALEQRALELEKRNSDLVSQVETLKGGANIEDLNRLTAHQAWRTTVSDLENKLKAKDAEIARARSGSMSTGSGNSMDWYRVEALLEEHANYRESVGGKLQALRSDKEFLQKELHRKENDYQALELRLQTLQRRTTVL